MKRVQKVVAYITLGEQLLVLTHRDFPREGVQVPAGTVETGEPIYTAVLREAEEETGLKNLKLVRYLGAQEFDASAKHLDEIHERHFFHLECANPAPPSWQHWEMTPSGDDKTPVAFDLRWVEKEDAGLHFEFGALLDKIA